MRTRKEGGGGRREERKRGRGQAQPGTRWGQAAVGPRSHLSRFTEDRAPKLPPFGLHTGLCATSTQAAGGVTPAGTRQAHGSPRPASPECALEPEHPRPASRPQPHLAGPQQHTG